MRRNSTLSMLTLLQNSKHKVTTTKYILLGQSVTSLLISK